MNIETFRFSQYLFSAIYKKHSQVRRRLYLLMKSCMCIRVGYPNFRILVVSNTPVLRSWFWTSFTSKNPYCFSAFARIHLHRTKHSLSEDELVKESKIKRCYSKLVLPNKLRFWCFEVFHKRRKWILKIKNKTNFLK